MAHTRFGREGNKRNPPQDLISTLPQDIIHHILSFLPPSYEEEPSYDQVLRTAVVSKRFESLSRSFPSVIMNRLPQTSPKPYGDQEESWWPSFLDSASRIVMRYSSEDVRLQNFKLKVFKLDSEGDDRIDTVLRHALANCVGKVYFGISFPNNAAQDFPTTYSWRVPECAPPFVIRTLTLDQFTLDLQALISASPCLEHLRLLRCTLLGKNVTLSSPTLKILRLTESWCSEIGEDGTLLVLTVKAPNLEWLFSNGLSQLRRIDFCSCKRLKRITLMGHKRDEPSNYYFHRDWYEDQIPKLSSLEDLDLSDLKPSERLIISSLSLKKLTLEHNSTVGAVSVDAPILESLELHRLYGCKTLDITPCQHLRRMSLRYVYIDAGWLEDRLWSDFPLLQELQIIQSDNKKLNRVNISHAGLLTLCLETRKEGWRISLDTPRLLHFNYTHYGLHQLPIITDLKCPPSLTVKLHLLIYPHYYRPKKAKPDYYRPFVQFRLSDWERRANQSWKLWQFLELFSGFKCMTLYLYDIHEDLAFPHKGRFGLLLPFLDIEFRAKWCMDLIEKSILLSCHPRMLTFFFRPCQRSIIQFHYEEDTLQVEDSFYCKRHLVACWRCSLKRVTLVNFGGKQSRLRTFFIKNAKISNACIQQVSQ